MKTLGFVLQLLLGLALLAGTILLFAGGASMDATARPAMPCDFHPGAP